MALHDSHLILSNNANLQYMDVATIFMYPSEWTDEDRRKAIAWIPIYNKKLEETKEMEMKTGKENKTFEKTDEYKRAKEAWETANDVENRAYLIKEFHRRTHHVPPCPNLPMGLHFIRCSRVICKRHLTDHEFTFHKTISLYYHLALTYQKKHLYWGR
jgi:hypothetical protein